MSQVFLSYSSQDRALAEEIVSKMESRGISCWLAPRDIPLGSNYTYSIPAAIRESHYFMLLISESAQHSAHIIGDLHYAFDSKKTVIPLRIDQTPMPDSMSFLLSDVQIRDYTRARDAVIDNIVSFIKSSEPTAPEAETELPKIEDTVYHVFVSHSTANDEIAQSIVEHLENQNISCWIAPRDTRSHTTYPAQITQAVRNCPVFLLLVSQKAMESSHVEREISLAIDKNISRGYKYIIPLMLEDCVLTDEFCYYLANLHYYAYHRDAKGILDKVTAQIHQFVEKEKSSEHEYLKQARGLFEEKRYRDGFYYFQKAARLGNTEAQAMLGYCYHVGKGCDRDIPNAISWYQKAVKGGSVNAEANLALCYANEGGSIQNPAKAAELFHSAANKGHAGAQRHLASLYEKGIGVEKNLEMAKKWYEKSAAQGDQYAQKRLQEIA